MDDEADGLPKPSLFGTFMVAVETYGWFMLIGAFVLYYVYHKLRTQWPQVTRKLKNDDDEESMLKHMRSVEMARKRQEEVLRAAQERFLEEKRIKEENAIKERSEAWEKHKQGMSQKKKTATKEEELDSFGLAPANKPAGGKPRLRPTDYNPLTGNSSSGSSSYRSSKSYCTKKSG